MQKIHPFYGKGYSFALGVKFLYIRCQCLSQKVVTQLGFSSATEFDHFQTYCAIGKTGEYIFKPSVCNTLGFWVLPHTIYNKAFPNVCPFFLLFN